MCIFVIVDLFVPMCSREAEASVKAKLHDGSHPTASGAGSIYGSQPATALSHCLPSEGFARPSPVSLSEGFSRPSPVSLSTPGAGGRSQAELAAIHAARHASAPPLLAATSISQSPPIPPDSCSSKIVIGHDPQWKGWKFADISTPAMKTAVSSAVPSGNELQKAVGDVPSATAKSTNISDQRIVKSARFANPFVSALPCKETAREILVDAPRFASLPPPIPDDILNYQSPSLEMRAKYRLRDAENSSKDEGALCISDEIGAPLTRERRTAQRSALLPAPVHTLTSPLSANNSAANPSSGYAGYKALVLSPEKRDFAEAAVYEAAGYRSLGPDHQYTTSQEWETQSGETTTLIVSPILTVGSLESPVMRNVDQGSPLFTSSPGGWFGLASPDTRPCAQLAPVAPPPLSAVVGQRASGSERGVAVHHNGCSGSGAGGLWGSLEGGAVICKVSPSESPHSLAARAGAKGPGKS